eukprot:15472-Heterococcus_DN1.PRE.2
MPNSSSSGAAGGAGSKGGVTGGRKRLGGHKSAATAKAPLGDDTAATDALWGLMHDQDTVNTQCRSARLLYSRQYVNHSSSDVCWCTRMLQLTLQVQCKLITASSVPPKRGMSSLIEDMMAAGVSLSLHYILLLSSSSSVVAAVAAVAAATASAIAPLSLYNAQQKSPAALTAAVHTLTAHCYYCFVRMHEHTCVVQAIAENMGIETDWNCAISLRPLDEPNTPDPHRMTSSYADWDVKARLPHGIAAIREHIQKVDNVPLLVSLFTDATTPTTQEMLQIFQEYNETVLCVGTSYRAPNAGLFRTADLSLLQGGLPVSQPLASLPDASPTQLSTGDILFNSVLSQSSSCTRCYTTESMPVCDERHLLQPLLHAHAVLGIVGLYTALPLGDVLRQGGVCIRTVSSELAGTTAATVK